jgi:hypothetical protein
MLSLYKGFFLLAKFCFCWCSPTIPLILNPLAAFQLLQYPPAKKCLTKYFEVQSKKKFMYLFCKQISAIIYFTMGAKIMEHFLEV